MYLQISCSNASQAAVTCNASGPTISASITGYPHLTMQRTYSGMNAEYYVGMETCFYPLPEDHAPPSFKKVYEGMSRLLSTLIYSTAAGIPLACDIPSAQGLLYFTLSNAVGNASPNSGSSSNTATQMEDELEEADTQATHATSFGLLAWCLDRPLAVRKRPRKPTKRTKTVEAEAHNIHAHKKPGRKPKAAGEHSYGSAVLT